MDKCRISLAGVLLLAAACAGYGCSISPSTESHDIVPASLERSSPERSDQFGDYWYQGQAEITSYDLEQARYGEIHKGSAVLIYVTEPFSETKQVKVDDPESESVTVLKLNAALNFHTGIYPYSMMTSVFTPVDLQSGNPTLKVTTSSQEWCGHTFTQINRKRNRYRLRLFSYFESEGDQDVELKGGVLEDELWNWIRLDPSTLPQGEVRLIPGGIYQRLSHADWRVRDAHVTLHADPGDPSVSEYVISYPELERTLTIRFSSSFPYEILGWEETRSSGFGAAAASLTTRATRKESMMIDYWTRNGVADLHLREELGLSL